jgi:hypothetical protein
MFNVIKLYHLNFMVLAFVHRLTRQHKFLLGIVLRILKLFDYPNHQLIITTITSK